MSDQPPPNGPSTDGWVVLEGERYELVRYGDETYDDVSPWEVPCPICGTEPGRRHTADCRRRGLHLLPSECRDCGVGIGEIHVGGCGIERCPRCNGQYQSCDTPDFEIDFPEILRESQEKMGPEWWAQYGKASWLAGLVVFGEISADTTWETLPKYLRGPADDPPA